MTDETKTRIPAPLYAAAGAGDLAYEKLRKLPTVVTELRGKAVASTTELRERARTRFKVANDKAAELQKQAALDIDMAKLREAAMRNRDAFLAGAHKAQVRATAAYTELVARGERVVGTGVVRTADVVNADLETTEAPELPAATPKDVAEAVSANGDTPAKRTRAAKRTA